MADMSRQDETALSGTRRDERIDPSGTGGAPSFHSLFEAPSVTGIGTLPELGKQVGDFELIRLLGKGSFASVFLARQISLDRHVALKVSAIRGREGQTLACLEHEHIVRVFSETVDDARQLRLLCMQFVPGTTLERLIDALEKRDPRNWTGRAIVEILDDLCTDAVPFDPAALRGRETLAASDFSEAVCWFGTRLAEALAHAHSQGVLHRDIKPANILLNRYGRPLLADFNIALDSHRSRGAADAIFGGTLGYMAPEHLDAFNPNDATPQEVVDERSDLFSLGVVLYELLTCKLPFAMETSVEKPSEVLRRLADERRDRPPSLKDCPIPVPDVMERVVKRCMAPKPEQRPQSAAELAAALDGCRQMRQIERRFPDSYFLLPFAQTRPFLFLLILILLPHFLGSAVNIVYNTTQIVGHLTPAQKATFGRLVLVYNLVTYSIGIALAFWLIKPVVRAWRCLKRSEPITPSELAATRRRLLSIPTWAVGLSCAGWLPGGLLFPLGIHLLSEPLALSEWWHFLVSFTISGLIALTYCYLGVQFLVLRVLYPRLWSDPRNLHATIQEELGERNVPVRRAQLLAGSIPLAGALLMVGVGPEGFAAGSYQTYRALLTALIALGMLGFGIALFVSTQLNQIVSALLQTDRRNEG